MLNYLCKRCDVLGGVTVVVIERRSAGGKSDELASKTLTKGLEERQVVGSILGRTSVAGHGILGIREFCDPIEIKYLVLVCFFAGIHF